MRKFSMLLLSLLAMLFGVMNAANATIDVTAVTSGITDAGTAIGLIIAGLLALSVALFGLVKVYRFVSKKAGA